MLLATGLPPFVGWIAGWVLLLRSLRWTLPEKVVGAVVVPMAMPLTLLYFEGRSWDGMQSCADPLPGSAPSDDFGCVDLGPPTWRLWLYAAGAVVAVVVAVQLWRSAGRDRRTSDAETEAG